MTNSPTRCVMLSLAFTALSALSFASSAASPSGVRVSDIVGSSENAADDKFYKRGFLLVDGKESGEESFKTYFNAKTRQCVMAEIMDNKVISINPTNSPKCGQKSTAASPAAPRAVKVSDIAGSSENGADDMLFKRGFTLVDGKESGGESFKTYYNGKTRQCVMLEIMDNKVISINPTKSATCR